MTLGEYIKAYREAHGESQRSFAARCGLSNTNISFLERGIIKALSGSDHIPATFQSVSDHISSTFQI